LETKPPSKKEKKNPRDKSPLILNNIIEYMKPRVKYYAI